MEEYKKKKGEESYWKARPIGNEMENGTALRTAPAMRTVEKL